MFGEKRELLSYPPWLLAVFGCMGACFVLFILYLIATEPKAYVLQPNEVIAEMTITGEYGNGGRGNPVFYSTDHFIPGTNKLTHIHCDNKKDYDRYNVNLKTLKQKDLEDEDYRLGKVAYPYTLYKGKDSLVHVRQEGCSLTFNIGQYDNSNKHEYVWWVKILRRIAGTL